MTPVDDLPDPRSLSREELASRLRVLTRQESDLSGERRVLHAQIDALRVELVARMRADGQNIISGADVIDPGDGDGSPQA